MAERRWLIVADDLSGAADSAIAFARRGLRTRILTRLARASDTNAEVLAFDADSRRLTPAGAAARHREAVQAFGAPGARVFKKIDSTLRGHPGAEIAAMLHALADFGRDSFGVLAPAFPAMGRTTREGRVFVHGKALEQDETWRREHHGADPDLVRLLARVGVQAINVPLARVRSGTGDLREELAAVARRGGLGPVAVCDAETDDDLDRIVSASTAMERPPFCIGTGGLTHALARTLPVVDASARQVAKSAAGALIVVGSLSEVSRHAARELARHPGVIALPVNAGVDAAAVRALAAGTDVLVELEVGDTVDLRQGADLLRALSTTLAGALREMSGLIATGGETAAALLAQRLVQEIELVDELEAGVALGLARGGAGTTFPLVTKAGAFGDSRSLVRALEKMRIIRSTGTLA